MSKPLVIVESPNKVKKLKSYKGDEYEFAASVGHFRDLPEKEMGVTAPDYKPTYVVTNKDVAKKLKSMAKGRDVILATDPDREGEAIAWHLADELRLKNAKRVTFDEITQTALNKAFANARAIDMNLVRAQEGRRVLDRLVGYRVSSALSDLAGDRHSAGRVQSPALRLVVDREREIVNFKSQTHYSVIAKFNTHDIEWQATWDFKQNINNDAKLLLDKAVAFSVATVRDFTVAEIKKEEKSRKPPAAFTTSTLQQAASSALKIKPKQTMEIAQQLFADGLITYMRTDSPNLSDEAIQSIWQYLKSNNLSGYVATEPNRWKSKAGAQEAHEAIRPTDIHNKQPELEGDAARLYDLIWTRAVASQMQAARYDVTTVLLSTDKVVNNKTVVFKASGRVLKFEGWLKLTDDKTAEDKSEDEIQALPALVEKQTLQSISTEAETKQTEPPKRYSEAGLIKELEKRGIGRPSTYASIMETLFRRDYVQDNKNQLQPTERGNLVRDCLVDRFAFAEYDYTKAMEDGLDAIAEGQGNYLKLITDVDNKLSSELTQLAGSKNIDVEQHPCPSAACAGMLRRRTGKHGVFWGCTNYPDCKESRPDNGGKPGEAKQVQASEFACGVCGKSLIRHAASAKKAKKGKPAGFWWGCSGFPQCKQTYQDSNSKPVFNQ